MKKQSSVQAKYVLSERLYTDYVPYVKTVLPIPDRPLQTRDLIIQQLSIHCITFIKLCNYTR